MNERHERAEIQLRHQVERIRVLEPQVLGFFGSSPGHKSVKCRLIRTVCSMGGNFIRPKASSSARLRREQDAEKCGHRFFGPTMRRHQIQLPRSSLTRPTLDASLGGSIVALHLSRLYQCRSFINTLARPRRFIHLNLILNL